MLLLLLGPQAFRVKAINVSGLGLVDVFNLTAVAGISSLQSLDISHNNFSGARKLATARVSQLPQAWAQQHPAASFCHIRTGICQELRAVRARAGGIDPLPLGALTGLSLFWARNSGFTGQLSNSFSVRMCFRMRLTHSQLDGGQGPGFRQDCSRGRCPETWSTHA